MIRLKTNKDLVNAIVFTLFFLICGVLGVVIGELVITYFPVYIQMIVAFAGFALISWMAYKR